MAGQIVDDCNDYTAAHAAEYDGRPEDEAVAGLADALRLHAETEGWEPLHYHVDVEEVARQGLRLHRSRE
jgi:hypothetical protein